MADPMNRLAIENLYHAFGQLVVTNNINLTVAAGERHVIIGPNGAGKTSLVHQIGGQLRPASGRIIADGVDITGWPPDRVCRAGVARTFQKNNLFANLSVLENLRLAVQAHSRDRWNFFTPVGRRLAPQQRARELLAQVRLVQDPACPVRNLSYGEQRQLEIALALAGAPDPEPVELARRGCCFSMSRLPGCRRPRPPA
jgi:branched-chain amino acid transport system ATP-binding protein